VREHADPVLASRASLAARADEVTRRCRTALQTRAAALDAVDTATAILRHARHVTRTTADPIVALV
jgi:hypothetical protein